MNLENLAVSGLVFFVSVWLTGRLSSPASRLRLLDHPNERSLHGAPVPRTGGLAILASLALGVLLAAGWAYLRGAAPALDARRSLWIVGMLLPVAAVSLWNDWLELPAGLRLAVHGLAAAGVVLGAGLTIEQLRVPSINTWRLGWLAVPLTILCLVWMTNLYNFMDGMDGFAGGMAAVGFSFLGYLGWRGGDSFIATLSLLTVGATSGFLLYNRPPARIFMGDVGSTLLGFLAGALAVLGVHQGLFELWVPVLIFSPFIVDASVTLCRRLLKGERVWQAHRQHYYQRMVLLGWSHRKTVLAEYCLMLASGSSAVIYPKLSEGGRLSLLIAWLLVYAGLGLAVCLAEGRTARSGPAAERDVR
ncbi:MAG TPA: glycosyltransferase family 4 protein [Pyrinomonadaceae bacterium]